MVVYVLDLALGLALIAAFSLLTAIGVISWLRRGGRVNANIGWAAGLLALVSLAFRVHDLVGARISFVVVPVVVAGILGSGYALLMLRDALVPFRPHEKPVIRAALVVVGVSVAVVGFPLEFEAELTSIQAMAMMALSVTWAACVGEPIIRFWRRAKNLSVVQRARMRALSLGYGGLILVLIGAGTMVDSASGQESLQAEVGILLGALVLAIVLTLAFAPPRWIRRIWREREERALLHATGQDIFTADDREIVAQRALVWAMRLVGSDRGVFVSPERVVLSSVGQSETDARALVKALPTNGQVRIARLNGRSSPEALVIPVRLESGVATMIVVAGAFTPAFGDDEAALLAHFGSTVAAALDRLRVDEIRRSFLSAVSHELRTPLTSVLGLGHTLQHPEMQHLSEDRRLELIDSLVRNAERLDGLLGDLLDLDRLSRGIIEARRRIVDASSLARSIVEQADATFGSRRVVVETDRPVTASIDPPMIERIVENLIANAVKHTPDTSTIWIAVRAEHGHLVLEVADDGAGIPEQMREAIFEPFHRGPSAPEHSPGSGVGLSLVARFAELHEGSAWVEERPGGGASFRVLLPNAIASGAEPREPAPVA